MLLKCTNLILQVYESFKDHLLLQLKSTEGINPGYGFHILSHRRQIGNCIQPHWWFSACFMGPIEKNTLCFLLFFSPLAVLCIFSFYFPLIMGIWVITDFTSPKEHYSVYFLIENVLVHREIPSWWVHMWFESICSLMGSGFYRWPECYNMSKLGRSPDSMCPQEFSCVSCSLGAPVSVLRSPWHEFWWWHLRWIKFNQLLIEIIEVPIPNPPHPLPLTYLCILLSYTQETS